jgi:2-polyprenyl-3-methyl-5-hydroxy-6-metoxy-1,4-benzoquinol methylase
LLTTYDAINESVYSLVPEWAARILDVGCGTGTLGAKLCRRQECRVVGITYSQREAELASGRLSQAICADLNQFDFSPLGQFDCVILSHILEHLYSPEAVLQRLKYALRPESMIVVALPNVLFWRQRWEFLMGRWRYQDGGIMDRTHFRFFDYLSSETLLENAGYKILATHCDGAFPMTRLGRKVIGSFSRRIDALMCTRVPGLFAFQFVYVAKLRELECSVQR